MEMHARVEELMDKTLEHKLSEYESRLGLVESELRLISKDINESKAKTDVIESDANNLHRETLRRFVEFGDKLGQIARELASLKEELRSDEQAIERIHQHEEEAVSNVRKWEKKTVTSVKKQLSSKKTLDAVTKKLLSGKNKKRLDAEVRKAAREAKNKAALVQALLRDKKLRGKIVSELTKSARAKLRRERVTTKVAAKTASKIAKRVRKAIKTAAGTP